MRVRRLLAIWTAKLVSTGCKLAGKQGVTLAGKIALKIDPKILHDLAGQVREKIFVVCGTNGKTTTNNLLCSAIESEGKKLVCNHTGSNMLDGVEVRLEEDYLEKKAEYDALADKVIYTGPIDAYFGYSMGYLEYRSVRFETELLDKPNFQGNAAVNYTDRETPWTRIIEHKWFEFGKDVDGNDLPKTVISREYSSEWKPGDEPYYPVNDEKNGALYAKYKELAQTEDHVVFGGRLGEYKYYDMDAVIASALDMCEKELA